MHLRRDYAGWDPADPLDPEAESVLSFLEEFAASGLLPQTGEVVASITGDGMVQADVPIRGTTGLFLQAGDGWDRVLWTCPSGRVHEWRWSAHETPGDLIALLGGRGVERSTVFRGRRAAVSLVVGGRTLATPDGRLRLRLLRRLGVRLRKQDAPAL